MIADDDLQRMDIDELKRSIRALLGDYKVKVGSLPRGMELFRAVPWQERPTQVSHVSYPPREVLDRVRLQRANRDGQAVFYCSCAGPAVFYEMRAQPGQRFAFSEWHVTEPLWMHHVGFHPDTHRRFGAPEELVRRRLSNAIPQETPWNSRIRLWLSEAFTADVPVDREYRYKLTVAVNELLYDDAKPLRQYADGIGPAYSTAAGTIYPCIQLRGCADNVVLRPEFVDRSLRLASVRYVEVLEADNSTMRYKIRTISLANDFTGAVLNWDAIVPQEDENITIIRWENNAMRMFRIRGGKEEVYGEHPAWLLPA